MTITLDPLTTDNCDHRFQAKGHDPGVKLRHLSQVRHVTCTSPVCRRPAATCDFEHNTPYEAGGRTCICNGGPKCRHDHRLKQDRRWKVDQLPGKPRKYETPWQQNGGIDVPPGIRDKLGDPSVPLLVTEGSRKADAAVSAGLCCVSVSGVWNWRGTNAVGGKVALPDWHGGGCPITCWASLPGRSATCSSRPGGWAMRTLSTARH